MSKVEQSQADFIRKWEKEINQLNYHELIMLNQMAVDRIKLIQKAENLMHMAKFNVGELVIFTGRDGIERQGKVMRINQKTISVQTEAKGYWNVSPELLRKVKP